MYNSLTNLSLHLNYDYTILLHLPKLPGYFCRKIMTDEKKCVRFRPVYDILLLREVVAKQPDGKVSWDEVVVNVNTTPLQNNSRGSRSPCGHARPDCERLWMPIARTKWHPSEREFIFLNYYFKRSSASFLRTNYML